MGTLTFVVLAAVAGAAFFYFFLRANPNKRAAIDAEVDRVKAARK